MTTQWQKLILASTSIFRKSLFNSTGLKYSAIGSTIDESLILGSSPRETALLRARAKAQDVADANANALVVGCDQVLGMGDQIFGKAINVDQARQRLHHFSGRTHILYSAVALAGTRKLGASSDVLQDFVIQVEMKMRKLSDAEIERYLATNEWQGCVGCYRYEEKGIHLMESADGDSSSIIGLPLLPLLKALRGCGFNFLA